MSGFRGFEKLENILRMEDDANTNTETEVDVSVKVAEEVEAESQLAEAADDMVSSAEASDEAAEDAEQLEMWAASLRKHGMTKQGLFLMNNNKQLEFITNRVFPSVESLDAVGTNADLARIALEGIGERMGGYWKSIKAAFKVIWEKLMSVFRWIKERFVSWEKSLKALGERLKPLDIDEAALDKKEANLLSSEQATHLAAALNKVGNALDEIIKSGNSSDSHAVHSGRDLFEALGLELAEDGKVTTKKGVFEASKGTLKAKSWNKGSVESAIGTTIRALQTVAGLAGKINAVKGLMDAAEKEITQMERADGKDAHAEARKTVEAKRKAVTNYVRVVDAARTKGTLLARTVLSAGAAVASCKKGAEDSSAPAKTE